jgi:hypothetical protein
VLQDPWELKLYPDFATCEGAMNDSKSFSFADAYGLGLIAKKPEGHDWSEIRNHLSADAREIADEIISPGHGTREVKSAAQDLLKLAQKCSGCPLDPPNAI